MLPRGRILIADRNSHTRTDTATMLHDDGYVVETASDGFKALHKIREFSPEVVLAEVDMPGMDGMDLMAKGREAVPGTAFLIMTDGGTIEGAVSAVRRGAFDYVVKPLERERIGPLLDRAVESARAAQQARKARPQPVVDDAFDKIIAEHPSMVSLLQLVKQIAPSRASVLLEGESGTGKGLIAEAIHRASLRAERPFVRLSCAELTESLLESEIFGHEKGAFTGAVARREGRFKQADEGTLFLDEVSEIPPATQVKLLRFMQERTFERVGGNETLRVDVRVISATNRSLKACVDNGSFRLDLFYRLDVVPLVVPPLRERVSDIPVLAGHFLRRFAQENGREVTSFSDEALSIITSYGWPGNVRELENVVERAVVLCAGSRVDPEHLPPHLAAESQRDARPKIPGATVYDLERWAILRTLEACGGSTSRAANILGISPRKIQYKLHEYREQTGSNGGRERNTGSSPADEVSDKIEPLRETKRD